MDPEKRPTLNEMQFAGVVEDPFPIYSCPKTLVEDAKVPSEAVEGPVFVDVVR
jgi:hypothetical protein